MVNIFILYSLSFVSLFNFLLAAILLHRGLYRIPFIYYIIGNLGISIWSLGILGYYFLPYFFRDISIWIKITHSAALILAYMFVLFFSEFPQKIKVSKYFNLFISLFFLINLFLLFFTKTIIKEVSLYYYTLNRGYIFYSLTLIFYFIIIYLFLYRQYKEADLLETKSQIFYITIGAIVGSLFPLFFDLLLPYLRIYNYTYLGPLFTLAWIITVGLSIIKYKFLNIRIISTELLTFSIWVVLLFRFLNAINLTDKILSFVLFISVLIFGILLIRSVYREVEQREKLEQLNKQLEELNKIKSEFLSFASHQVKTPMAVVKGYAELIEKEIENVPQEAKDFAHKIRKSVDNLISLVDEFLDYRRIEEGRMEFNFEKIEVVNLVKEIFENLRKLAEEKDLEYNFESQVSECYANIDKLRFSQVIQNLIDNAIKYTPKGFVNVSVFKEDNFLVIKVSDSGIGMSKELQKKLFGQFVRDPSIKKEIRGTGLGLYISKYIIDNHKGQIWAESEGEGKGSNFYIKIPCIFNS